MSAIGDGGVDLLDQSTDLLAPESGAMQIHLQQIPAAAGAKSVVAAAAFSAMFPFVHLPLNQIS